jgi:hypothetical protein
MGNATENQAPDQALRTVRVANMHVAALNLIDAASTMITNRPKGHSVLAFSAS